MASKVPEKINLEDRWGVADKYDARHRITPPSTHWSRPHSCPCWYWISHPFTSFSLHMSWNPLPIALVILTALGVFAYGVMKACHHLNFDPLHGYETVNDWIIANQEIITYTSIGAGAGMFVSYLAYKTHIRIRRGDSKDESWKNKPGLILGGGVKDFTLYLKDPKKAFIYHLQANPIPTVLITLAMCTAIYGAAAYLLPSYKLDPLGLLVELKNNQQMVAQISLGAVSGMFLSYLAYRTHVRMRINSSYFDTDDQYFTNPNYDFPRQ